MKFVFKSTVLLAILLSSFAALGQKPAEEFRMYKDQYPDDPYIVLKTEKHLEIGIQNGEPNITYSNSYKKFYLSDNANRFSSESVSHSDFRKLENLEA